jgi:lysophospholipase L1-like esterase
MGESRGEISQRGAFLAGALTALAVSLLLGFFVGLRVGAERMLSRIRDTVLIATGPKTARLLDLPGGVRSELARQGAVIENAGHPTRPRDGNPHDTILVEPDAAFGWVLRPDVEIEASVLHARNPYNWDPPVLVRSSRAALPDPVERYLRESSRLGYRYRTGADRRRLTVPPVEAERSVLVAGDSVAFGVGVDDDSTVASLLQIELGASVRIVNAGVGGYSGPQVLTAVEALALERGFEALVYLTSQNDFMEDPARSYAEVAEQVLSGMARLRERFSGRLVAVVVSYLQLPMSDVFLAEGWTQGELRRSRELYAALRDSAARHGIDYVDWLALVRDEIEAQGSLLAPFALYFDHGHLSRHGSRRAARAIAGALQRAGLR